MFYVSYSCHFRAEFTKYVVTPTLGMSGVGGVMAVYGFFDAIVSIQKQLDINFEVAVAVLVEIAFGEMALNLG